MEKYEPRYFDYDVNKYPFVRLVENLFEVDDLSEIHTLLDTESPGKLFTNENDDATKFHDKFYKKLNSGWDDLEETYKNFVKTFKKL